jgi:hypothetical protein
VGSVALVTLAMCTAWHAGVAGAVAPLDSEAFVEVRSVWRWLAVNRQPHWRRVYLQDLWEEAGSGPASFSHVLALTSSETGVRQLGAFYESIPVPAAAGFAAQGTLFARVVRSSRDADFVIERALQSGCSHLVTTQERLRPLFAERDDVRERFRAGRLTVYELRSSPRPEVLPLGGARLLASRVRPGIVSLTLDVSPGREGGASLLVGHHPFWEVTRGPGGIRLSADRDFMLRLEGVAAGRHEIELSYEPPVWPSVLAVAAAAAIVGLLLRERRRRSLTPPRTSS